MPTTPLCRYCRSPLLNKPAYDLVRQDGLVWFGQWRWVWRCQNCQKAVEEHDQESQQPGPSAPQRTESSFQMF